MIEVCKAIQDMKAEVEEITAKKVTENTRLLDLKNLMRNMKLTAEQAAAALGIPQAEQASLLKKL